MNMHNNTANNLKFRTFSICSPSSPERNSVITMLGNTSSHVVLSYDSYFRCSFPYEATKDEVELLYSIQHSYNNFDFCPTEEELALLSRANLVNMFRPCVEDLAKLYARNGLAIIDFFSPEYSSYLQSYFSRQDNIQRSPDLEGIKRVSINDLTLMQYIQGVTCPVIAQILGRKIRTSYSFSSTYERGSTLPRHTDRPGCDFNISLVLDADDQSLLPKWPLFIETHGQINSVSLKAGQAVLYRGTVDPHWRDAMPVELAWVHGVFFHYLPGD